MPSFERVSPGVRGRWLVGKPLGQGAFGTVYLGFNLDTGGFMAVKQVLLAQHPTLAGKASWRRIMP